MNHKEYDRKLLDLFAARLGQAAVICDAGCGPSGHIGKYVFDKGINVVGVDISEKCIELAQHYNPKLRYALGDIVNLPFEDKSFDGVISYYSIIDTPKRYMNRIFKEFCRVLKTDGYLLVVVKAGDTEGYISDLLGIKAEIYFTLFTEDEIANNLKQGEFDIEFLEIRNPYDFEINNNRIFAIGKKK